MTPREIDPPEPDDEPEDEEESRLSRLIGKIVDDRLDAFYDRHRPRSEEEAQLGKLGALIRDEVNRAIGSAPKGVDNGKAGASARNDRRPARAGSGGNERPGGFLGFLYGQPDD